MQSAFAPKPTATNKKAEPARVNSKSYTSAYSYVNSKFCKRYYVTLYMFSGLLAILFQLGFSLNYHNFYNVLSLKTFFFSLLLFTVGSTLSVLRSLKFTVWEPTYSSNIAEFLSVCTSSDNLLILAAHIISSLVVICSYFSWIMEEKYTLNFLLQPPGHYLGARQLNQEKIFIYLYAFILGFNYTVDFLVNRNFVVKINNVQQPFDYEIKNSLGTVLCKSAMRALRSFRNTYVIFVICNGSIYYFVARIFGSYYRVLDSPIVGFRWIDIHLFLRLIVAGILTTTVFNLSNRIYDAIYSYTLPYTDPYANQFECLIQGLSNKEHDLIRAVAFSELALLSNKRPDKRKALFNVVGNELHENAWYKIMTQCLLVIDDIRTKIDIEYNGVQPVATPTPVAKPVEQTISNRLTFSNGPIFTETKKNQVYYDDRTSSIFSEVSELAENIPAHLPQPETVITSSIGCLKKSVVVDMIKSLEFRFGSIGVLESVYADTVLRRMQTVFNKYQLVIWAVQSLGSLTSGSLKEDAYGFVQNDIEHILNSLLACLVQVEKYVQSPPTGYKKLLDQHLIPGEVEAVILALKEAIYQITTTFSSYTENFKIDNKHANKWNSFLNFQE
ncbi:nucleoporin protein Ndc1-Nup [Thamnidium elegans]|nr:nucleoporin protein Ndc1-Nup [Thamnidium elegans]